MSERGKKLHFTACPEGNRLGTIQDQEKEVNSENMGSPENAFPAAFSCSYLQAFTLTTFADLKRGIMAQDKRHPLG